MENKELMELAQKLAEEIAAKGNVLYGKKWVACGDSFTEGDFSRYRDSNGVFYENNKDAEECEEIWDKEKNMFKTYPWWVAERNNMVLINDAKRGATMTGPDVPLAFSNDWYENIPADADYITLMFGINDDDKHQSKPIGNITDSYYGTFCGAWNQVLSYLIRKHPDAKIGIIIPNGCREKYTAVIRQMAARYGLPTLDLVADPNITYLVRGYEKTQVLENIRKFRDDHWFVNPNPDEYNMHPNLKAHKFISTIVENFLRSL